MPGESVFLPEKFCTTNFHDLSDEMHRIGAAHAEIIARKSDESPVGMMLITNDPELVVQIEALLAAYDEEGEEGGEDE